MLPWLFSIPNVLMVVVVFALIVVLIHDIIFSSPLEDHCFITYLFHINVFSLSVSLLSLLLRLLHFLSCGFYFILSRKYRHKDRLFFILSKIMDNHLITQYNPPCLDSLYRQCISVILLGSHCIEWLLIYLDGDSSSGL